MRAKKEPWHHALWDDADMHAIKALAKGEASAVQQQRAIQWIIHKAAGTYLPSFAAGQPDVSAFLEGRRSVGMQIDALIATPPSILMERRKARL